MQTEKTVSVDANTLKDAIDQILKDQHVNYKISGKNIIISKKTSSEGNATDQSGDKVVNGVIRALNYLMTKQEKPIADMFDVLGL